MDSPRGGEEHRERVGGARPFTGDDRPPFAAGEIDRIVEALLFVGSEPLDAERFRRGFPDVETWEFEAAIGRLRSRCRGERRPYRVSRTRGGYVLRLEPGRRVAIEQALPPDRGIKFARPVIEVLSLVAYRQPIRRSQLEEMLGQDPRGAVRQLLRRELITAAESDDGEIRYLTTPRFLELFGLESLEDLPSIEDVR